MSIPHLTGNGALRHVPVSVSSSSYEQFLAQKSFSDIASGFDPDWLLPDLYPFQAAIVRWAVRRGRAAIFADTGLGKTIQQVAWADAVHRHTGRDVLILAPLCVARQTVEEAARFGVTVRYCRHQAQVQPGISIANYEMLEHFTATHFVGIVLDESSILKSQESQTRQALIMAFGQTPYRLACTATPSPNDYMELGNHAEFLGIMTASEMLAMFFTHDGGDTQSWRLKGHGQRKFWEWMAIWAVCIRKPSDLGDQFSDEGYVLPPLRVYEHILESAPIEGELLPKQAQTLSERRLAKRMSIKDRIAECALLIKSENYKMKAPLIGDEFDEKWIIWCFLNAEQEALERALSKSDISFVSISGSTPLDKRIELEPAWRLGNVQVMITKPSVFGWGMNWQHCKKVIFISQDDSFESYYQATRRCYRFGQTHPVDVHIFASESEGAIKANIERKQRQFIEMQDQMVCHMREFTRRQVMGAAKETADYQRDIARGEGWELHLGDCVDVVAELADNSIDYTVFSPPFAQLYVYSNSERDMGNCRNASEFYQHFIFLVKDLFRVTKPGRLLSFHCMNLPTNKFRDGYIGLQDFRGDLIRMFVDAGWIYHSEVTIWKDPVNAMHRTKALGLLWKQLKKDSAMSRQGVPDYLVTMRKPGINADPISHSANDFPVELWQRYASPVWFDINPSNTLQFRTSRDQDDEKHIAPLQLEVIERALTLWSKPGDCVLSPFAGIGSEGYVALQMNRRFIGAELKPAYWALAVANLKSALRGTGDLFAENDNGEPLMEGAP